MAALPRATLQRLAIAKIEDARLLHENRRYSNSYYLYGYGIELGLKACIARQMIAETVPDKAVLRGFLDHEIGNWLAWRVCPSRSKQSGIILSLIPVGLS